MKKDTTQEVLTIRQKLQLVQCELKAPKSQFNAFGNYHYRNAEDIQEAIKPLQEKYKFTTTIEDTIELIGTRFYVKATATFADCESDTEISTKAYAREPENKKGMDEAQITGATSSYARKYALNALFLIDDTKDADSQDNTAKGQTEANKPVLEHTYEQKAQILKGNEYYTFACDKCGKSSNARTLKKDGTKYTTCWPCNNANKFPTAEQYKEQTEQEKIQAELDSIPF